MNGHTAAIEWVAFSADGQWITTASADQTYTVETTSDLAADSWTPATTRIGPTVPLNNGVEQLTIRDSVVRSEAPRFIRVRAMKL